jgi:hypothetical protein
LFEVSLPIRAETLPTINKPKHPKKEGPKWKDPHPRKQKNNKANIKFLKPLLWLEAY